MGVPEAIGLTVIYEKRRVPCEAPDVAEARRFWKVSLPSAIHAIWRFSRRRACNTMLRSPNRASSEREHLEILLQRHRSNELGSAEFRLSKLAQRTCPDRMGRRRRKNAGHR